MKNNRNYKLCVYVPSYNGAQTLPSVIERIPAEAWPLIERVFIVDDGSRDNTVEVVEDISRRFPKVTLYSFPENRGYGSAVRQGLILCRTVRPDYCVCVHADGQYPPEKIVDFVDFMKANQVDILQGSRHKDGTALKGNMPFYKFVAGKILTALENLTFGYELTDYHSGFMFYSQKALDSINFNFLSNSFDFDLEVIATARSIGLKVDELGIPTHYGDEKSYLNPVTYGLRVVRVMVRYLRGYYCGGRAATSDG